MTLGKDVSGLFTAVVNCMMTPHLEVRKLVYLYLINYAKTQVRAASIPPSRDCMPVLLLFSRSKT